MDEGAAALVAAAAGLLGALIGGLLAFLGGRADRRERERAELAAAAAATLFALDQLHLEVGNLPPVGRTARRVNGLVARYAPTLDWYAGVLVRHTTGRSAQRAIKDFMRDANRLLLVAPLPLRQALLRVTELLGEFDERGDEWSARWRAARDELQVTAQRAVR